MIDRAEVERAIVDDESLLERVASLLESRSDLAEWPEDARLVLALALDDNAVSGAETRRGRVARRLRPTVSVVGRGILAWPFTDARVSSSS